MPTNYCLDIRSNETAKFALLSEKPISFKDVDYWPKYYFADQGGYIHFIFTVCFNDTIPDEFTYTIELLDRNKAIAHALTDTLPTRGKTEVPVQVLWDGKINNQTMPLGAAYAPHIVVTANLPGMTSGAGIMEVYSVETEPCGGVQGAPTPPPECSVSNSDNCAPDDCNCQATLEAQCYATNPQSY